MGITQRKVLVVGGTGDIGGAICEDLLAAGYRVIVSGITLEQATRSCKSFGNTHATPIQLDVTDEESCATAVRMVVDEFGGLDCMVNCAGVSYISPVLLGKVADWRRVLEVNTLGAFTISKAVLRPMVRARYGRIVHIGSISADVGASYNAIYAASKAGVAGLVRSLALEVAANGITVNAVQPGYVKTKLFAETQGSRARIKGVTLDQHEKDLIADTPTRRLVTPGDVATLVSFLIDERSQSITGQCVNVDGGRSVG